MRTTYLVTVSSSKFRLLRQSIEIAAEDRADAARQAREFLTEVRGDKFDGGAWDRWKTEEPAPKWPHWRQADAGTWGDD